MKLTRQTCVNSLKYCTLLILSIFSLIGCNPTSNGNVSPQLACSLVGDQVSAIPVVNNAAGTYAIFVKNTGFLPVSGLNWSLNTSSGGVTTLNANNCNSINAGSSCELLLKLGSASNYIISGNSNLCSPTAVTVSGYKYTTQDSGNMANALVLSNFSPLLVASKNPSNLPTSVNYFGAMTVNVINNYSSSIDVTNLFGTLPSGVSWSEVSCPNPLPSDGVCQVRITYSGILGSDITALLHPSGTIINTDGSKTPLPSQNSSGSVTITKQQLANLNIQASSLSLDGNSPSTNNSVVASIQNSGTAAATITSVTISNNTNSLFSISNNGCTGELAAGSVCQYTITANVSKLATTASGNYSTSTVVSYNNNIEATTGSGIVTYSYTAVTPPPPPPPTPESEAVPVTVPGLAINGTLPSSLFTNEPQTVQLELTNDTTATNGGSTDIVVNMNSLTSDIGTNLSGSLNTTGITTNACSASSGNMTLTANQTCYVNLVLTASGGANSSVIATITPSYEYYKYTTGTASTLTAATGSELSSLSGSIAIEARSASLQLAYYTTTSYSTALSSFNVEQGTGTGIPPSQTAILKVTNTGNTALTSFSLPSPSQMSGITFTPDNSCSTLGVDASCNVTISLSTIMPIASSNLNTNSLTYSDVNNSDVSVALRSLPYSVTAPNAPTINYTTKFVNCANNESDTTQTCNLNPDSATNTAGSAGAYELVITFTNSGSGMASNFNFTQGQRLQGYNSPTGCSNATLNANNGNCEVIYKLSDPTVAGNGNISVATTFGLYGYTYGSENQLSSNNNPATAQNDVNVNITQPQLQLTLNSPTSIPVGENTTVTATISSWYAGSIPSSVAVSSESTNIVAGITIPCTASGNNICSGIASVTGIAAGTTNLSASITAPDTTTIATNPLLLTVTPNNTYFVSYYPSGCTPSNIESWSVTGGIPTGAIACECIKDPTTSNIWYANGSSESGSWDSWTESGAALMTFNSSLHCGETTVGGWALPSMTGTPAQCAYFGADQSGGSCNADYTSLTGEWGVLVSEAEANGYVPGTNPNLANWLNDNGFVNVVESTPYLSANTFTDGNSCRNNSCAWSVIFDVGFVNPVGPTSQSGGGILLVHPSM